MERNSVNPSVLKWEKLSVHSYNKPIEIEQQIGFSMSTSNINALFGNEIENANASFSKYPFPASQESSKVAMDGFGKIDSLPRYDDPMIGLRLGRQKEYGNNNFFPSTGNKMAMPSVPIASTPAKRSRASYQNMQNPCCQVEGCNLDLKAAKDYHRRHRICESHSKSPKVIVAGMERRFCQQCSRFHDLSEFDDKKRSCRRRLSDHNARRRRVQPESIHLGSSTGLSSALYDQRQQNLLLNGLPISVSNSTWENASSSMLRQTLIRPSKTGGLDGTPCFSSDDIPKSAFELHMDLDSSNPRVLDQCLQVPTTNSPIAPNLLSAHSLLSSNSWSLNEGETSSIEGMVHGNYNPHSEPQQNLSLFHSFNIPLEQEPSLSLVQSVNLPNEGTSHQHEYRLFKATYDSAGFYSRQRNL